MLDLLEIGIADDVEGTRRLMMMVWRLEGSSVSAADSNSHMGWKRTVYIVMTTVSLQYHTFL